MRVWLLLCALASSHPWVMGQEPDFSAHDIRSLADEILADPEFRYFEHFGADGQVRGRTAGTGRNSEHQPSNPGQSAGKSGSNSPKGNSPSAAGSSPQTRPEASRPNEEAQAGPAPSIPRPTRNRSRAKPATPDNAPQTEWRIPDLGLGALGTALGYLLQGLAYLAIAAVVVLIIVLIVRAVATWERSSQSTAGSVSDGVRLLDDEHSPGDTPADEFVRQARELAAAERFQEAIARLLLGGMSHIERERLIRYRRGLTLRDYLRVLRGRDSTWQGFRTMVDQYEPLTFGRRPATRDCFDSALHGYELAFAVREIPS